MSKKGKKEFHLTVKRENGLTSVVLISASSEASARTKTMEDLAAHPGRHGQPIRVISATEVQKLT